MIEDVSYRGQFFEFDRPQQDAVCIPTRTPIGIPYHQVAEIGDFVPYFRVTTPDSSLLHPDYVFKEDYLPQQDPEILAGMLLLAQVKFLREIGLHASDRRGDRTVFLDEAFTVVKEQLERADRVTSMVGFYPQEAGVHTVQLLLTDSSRTAVEVIETKLDVQSVPPAQLRRQKTFNGFSRFGTRAFYRRSRKH